MQQTSPVLDKLPDVGLEMNLDFTARCGHVTTGDRPLSDSAREGRYRVDRVEQHAERAEEVCRHSDGTRSGCIAVAERYIRAAAAVQVVSPIR